MVSTQLYQNFPQIHVCLACFPSCLFLCVHIHHMNCSGAQIRIFRVLTVRAWAIFPPKKEVEFIAAQTVCMDGEIKCTVQHAKKWHQKDVLQLIRIRSDLPNQGICFSFCIRILNCINNCLCYINHLWGRNSNSYQEKTGMHTLFFQRFTDQHIHPPRIWDWDFMENLHRLVAWLFFCPEK